MFTALALAAGLAFVLIGLYNTRPAEAPADWRAPATLALLFLGWSSYAAVTEGPTGFWPEHVRNAWGNQIWFDLLLAAGVAVAALAPAARAVGMNTRLWLLLVAATGSVGLLAMLARLRYLQGQKAVG